MTVRVNTTLLKKGIAPVLAAILLLSTAIGMFAGCGRKPVAGPIIDGEEAYHVIVTAGEPEGVAAALAAARNGMKVLLVESGDALGGLMTLGMLNVLDQNYGPNGELLTQGIFQEFFKALGDAFEIEEAKTWFLKKCRNEPNITVMLNTEIIAPVMDGNTIIGLEIKERDASESKIVRSLAVIDATVDGDIAAASGAPYTTGGDDYGAFGAMQGTTLVFEVAGVNWGDVVNYLRNDDDPGSDTYKSTAWGYSREARSYMLTDSNMRFRGPNIGRQKNGNVLLNGLIIFGVDALDPDSYAEGIARGEREIPHIVEFMRENFAGFENAFYVRRAARLYVRETRHIIGEYRLTITDVLENRDQWDRIGHGNYAVDVQATSPDDSGNAFGQPEIYSIPFRCLVPLEIDQLLITGRSASYDSLPHGSARVLPVGMVTGEACGTAAAYSVAHGVTFREMTNDPDAILWLQNQLKKQGAYLTAYEPPRLDIMDHWAYDGLVVMRELGMASGGYNNDYRLDTDVSNRWVLQNGINRLMWKINEIRANRSQPDIPASVAGIGTDDITIEVIFTTAAERVSPEATITGAAEAQECLIQNGVLDEDDLRHFPDTGAIATYGQLYFIMGKLYSSLLAK